jgi:2-methylcitrate dehydratase
MNRSAPVKARDVLADFAHRLKFSSIPEEARHSAKRFLLDSLACIVGGYGEPSSRIARETAIEMGGPAEASILLSGRKVSAYNAVLANGVPLRALDLIDMYYALDHAHPCELSVTPALAIGERVRASGADVLTAIVLGYELCMKLAEITGNSRKGWAGTATLGQFAAPLVAGKLLGLSRRQLAEAVSISGAHNVSLAVTYALPVSMMKDALNAFAAQSGVQAALMAARGFTGPAGVFEAPGGLWAQLDSPAHVELLGSDLGQPFRITRCGFKDYRYSAVAWSHPAIEALLFLREAHRLDASNVKSIHVRTIRRATVHIGTQPVEPGFGRLDTQFNGPYIFAAALKFGDVSPSRQGRAKDPDIQRLSRCVTIEADEELGRDFPKTFPAVVTVTTREGRRLEHRIDQRRGDPGNPLSDADIEAKFRALAARRLSSSRVRAVIEAVWSLEGCEDINRLTELFSPEQRS